MATIKTASRVKILIRAGLCEPDDVRRFVAICEPGTEGQMIGPHPTLKGWTLVEVPHMGRRLVAPLGIGQYEAIPPERV